jgi:hemoglobin
VSFERPDIQTRHDCEQLVRVFYGAAFADDLLGPVFVDIAKLDLETHIPQITSFWESVLLGARSYSGGAFRPHVDLNREVALTGEMFQRWLEHWFATVDELYAGDVADTAKAHASRVAGAFHARLSQFTAMGM